MKRAEDAGHERSSSGKESMAGERRIEWSEDSYSRIRSLAHSPAERLRRVRATAA